MEKFQIVYALTNEAMPGIVKIGKTTRDPSIRMKDLYSTGVPVPFECIYAVEVNDCTVVEKAIHKAFGPNRINPQREFFKIDPEQVIAILELFGKNNASDKITEKLNSDISLEEQESSKKLRRQRPNMNFDEMGIKTGDKLVYVDDSTIEVEVISNKKVRYNNEELSLTRLTRNLLDIEYSIQPAPKWKHNGKLLKEIYDETYLEY